MWTGPAAVDGRRDCRQALKSKGVGGRKRVNTTGRGPPSRWSRQLFCFLFGLIAVVSLVAKKTTGCVCGGSRRGRGPISGGQGLAILRTAGPYLGAPGERRVREGWGRRVRVWGGSYGSLNLALVQGNRQTAWGELGRAAYGTRPCWEIATCGPAGNPSPAPGLCTAARSLGLASAGKCWRWRWRHIVARTSAAVAETWLPRRAADRKTPSRRNTR